MGAQVEMQWKGTSFSGLVRAAVIDSTPWSSVIDMPQGNGEIWERVRQRSAWSDKSSAGVCRGAASEADGQQRSRELVDGDSIHPMPLAHASTEHHGSTRSRGTPRDPRRALAMHAISDQLARRAAQ
ncbi:uncharacterized protein RHO25_006034 [Cercospora beticola]|uniref:Uncharacterized protein n=1 Tax=Cercospora beticola TaxID=122368 RepID=A0ABZ0NPH0_CERBT|nr:hypothetical protein RHO25_006034 [Cercospora beticola]